MLAVTANRPARVFVDGSSIGVAAPAEIPLDPGVHTVKAHFVRTDTESETRFVSIKPGEVTRINFILED